MQEQAMPGVNDNKIVRKNQNERREETDRAFAEIMERERRARLEKTMRLRSMRLVEDRSASKPHAPAT
jgi:hypothetical protein